MERHEPATMLRYTYTAFLVLSLKHKVQLAASLKSNVHVLLTNKQLYACFQFSTPTTSREYRGSTVVKVLCYKSEGRWFDLSW